MWVTNGQELLAGRLNRQIEELDAAVATASNDVDVFQDGDDVFLLDASVGSLERIDPSFTTLTQRIDVPLGSRVAYGGDVVAILSPKGELWTTPAGGDLSFDAVGTDPIAELGADARVAVSDRGTVFATSADDDELLRVDVGGGEPAVTPLPEARRPSARRRGRATGGLRRGSRRRAGRRPRGGAARAGAQAAAVERRARRGLRRRRRRSSWPCRSAGETRA